MKVTLMMKAVSSSETAVNIQQFTWCNIPGIRRIPSTAVIYKIFNIYLL